ncbi:hypothetical protein PORY_001809 [Pneumocystis oryctolagi]|uniref:Uncharacterized protein n=1 Tax=Pneumocystis oryctolagi TaxID=42067 RepID=A0ACB7CAJ6_9ASCO|nr:hypothetical protein PORY_001809 [Pneumocystis oryctolagi]
MIKDIGVLFAKSSMDIIVLSENITLQAGVKAILNASRRQLLFHDELARIFIILMCKNEDLNEQHLKWASYLSCTMDGWIDDAQRYAFQVSCDEKNKEHLGEGFNFFFRVVSNKKMISELIDKEMVIIWEAEMLIPYPRLRVLTPKVQLIASITVKPEILVMSRHDNCQEDNMFTNILESLSSETMIYGVTPFLSLSRVSNISIMPGIDSSSSIETLRKVVKKTFKCGPIISLRTRSSMVMVPNFQRILLSVDIESCSASQLPVLIENVEIKVKGRIAQRIENEIAFPITLAFQEQFLILYCIPFDPSIDQEITDLLALPVTIFVKMKPQLLDGSCNLSVMSQWYTTIHISKDQTRVSSYQSVIHTEAKSPSSNLFSQKYFAHVNNYNLLKSRSPELPDVKSPFWKISLTFTVPKCVKMWKVFEVEIVLVNQSNASKDISLSVLSKTWNTDYKIPSSILENSSHFLLEEKAIYTLHKKISVNPVHILPLTNDIRIVPLNSYGCYFCSISFIAIREGLFSLEGIRITDLHTNSYIDCCSLPRIFKYPILTLSITNSLLGGVSNVFAQTISAIQFLLRRIDLFVLKKNEYEMENIDFSNNHNKTNSFCDISSAFNFSQLIRFMSYSFFTTPIQHLWYSFLDRLTLISKTSNIKELIKRILMDQLLFTPISLVFFLVFMSLTEEINKKKLKNKFNQNFVSILKNNQCMVIVPMAVSEMPPVTKEETENLGDKEKVQKEEAEKAQMAHAIRGPTYSSRSPLKNRLSPAKEHVYTQRKMIGDWQLGKTVGSGSMGKVKLVTHCVTNEIAAVKIIPRPLQHHSHSASSGAQDNGKEIRAIREIAISSLLQHPYICTLRDVKIQPNHYYVFFEYINGGQMLDYIISHGKLKEKQARKFARQIGSALDYCHHLKIENILISKEGDIKIIDFGLSNLYSPHSHLSTFCGSLYFAAPELLNAKAYIGPEIDIWSFGVVLYVLVCGKVPFDDQNMPALHAKIKRGYVEYPSWLTSECKQLLSRMLVTTPSQRATLSEVLNHPWMTRGYDCPPENYLPSRFPITVPLDMEIIRKMTVFEFGSEQTIHAKLNSIIGSEGYRKLVKTYYNQSSDTHVLSLLADKKKTFFDFYKRRLSNTSYNAISTPTTENAIQSPSKAKPIYVDAYHPLISIYYLVKEKMEREKKNSHQNSHIHKGDIFEIFNISSNSTSIDQLNHKAHQGTTLIPRNRSFTISSRKIKDYISGSNQHPHISSPLSSPVPSKISNKHSHDPESVQHVNTTNQSADKNDSLSNGQPHLKRSVSVNDNTYSSNFKLSLSTRIPSMSKIHLKELKHNSADNKNHSLEKSSNIIPSFSFKRNRTKSLGNAKGEVLRKERKYKQFRALTTHNAFSNSDSPVQSTSNNTQSLNSNKPYNSSNEVTVKSGFLKGIFSVSTTTSKPPHEIKSGLARILTRLNISYRDIKGGFFCIYQPSIDLKNFAMNTVNSGGRFATQNTHVLRRSHSLHKTSSGKKKTNLDANFYNTGSDSDDSIDDGRNMGHKYINNFTIQFEIYIVKVPLFALHGLQFKRMCGNAWQYRSLASRIIAEMKL